MPRLPDHRSKAPAVKLQRLQLVLRQTYSGTSTVISRMLVLVSPLMISMIGCV